MEEPSLQSKLKIDRRDDVIGFPQLSTPLTHTYTHLLSQTQVWACICTHAYTHTLTYKGEGGFWVPGPQGQGSLVSASACMCMCTCVPGFA